MLDRIVESQAEFPCPSRIEGGRAIVTCGPRTKRGSKRIVQDHIAGGGNARVNPHGTRTAKWQLRRLVRRLVRIWCGTALRTEVTAEGQSPVFKGNNVAEEFGVVPRQTDHIAVGDGAEPAVLLENRMQFGVCSDERQGKKATSTEGQRRVVFCHANDFVNKVDFPFGLTRDGCSQHPP